MLTCCRRLYAGEHSFASTVGFPLDRGIGETALVREGSAASSQGCGAVPDARSFRDQRFRTTRWEKKMHVVCEERPLWSKARGAIQRLLLADNRH
jgi:hypothetical protein